MQAVAPDQKTLRNHLARIVLGSFLLAFLLSRIMVLLIMTRSVPDFYLHVGGNHVHHLNYGIFLLSIAGGWLLFERPQGRALELLAALYGLGLALTFDEFGMWLHLGGSYWQRASWDAIAVIGGILALIVFLPKLARFRSFNWFVTAILGVASIAFFTLLAKSLGYAERLAMPKLLNIEASSPL